MESQSSSSTMIKQAKQELQILESHYPNRFHYLKLDLKSFIAQLQSQLPLPKHTATTTNNNKKTPEFSPATSSTSTKESSNSKSKKRKSNSGAMMEIIVTDGQGDIDFEASKKGYHSHSSSNWQSYMKRKDRDGGIDAVIAKAQDCLHRIKHFKTNF